MCKLCTLNLGYQKFSKSYSQLPDTKQLSSLIFAKQLKNQVLRQVEKTGDTKANNNFLDKLGSED